MANLGQKDGIYHIRFHFRGREYKKSLKIRDRADAEAARSLAEVTIHRLRTGQIQLPDRVDAGDFIVTGGNLQPLPAAPAESVPEAAPLPSTRRLTEEYGVSVKDLLAPS